MKGPGYTMSDLFFWGGFIAGCGIGVTVLRQMGVTNQWVVLGCGLVLGMGVGWLLEKIHQGGPRHPQDPGM